MPQAVRAQKQFDYLQAARLILSPTESQDREKRAERLRTLAQKKKMLPLPAQLTPENVANWFRNLGMDHHGLVCQEYGFR